MKIPFFQRATAPANPKVAVAQTVVAHLRQELPELLAAAVGDVATGTMLAGYGHTKGFDPAKALPAYAALIQAKQRALAGLRLPEERIGDVLFTLTSQLHLLRLSADGQRFLYLAVHVRDINLAVAREVVRQQAEQL